MKKSIFVSTILLLTIMAGPLKSNAGTSATKANSVSLVPEPESVQANVLISRLNEIKDMDKSNLGAGERKEMRKEVRSINKQLRDINSSIYLSAGAVIIILLLLILLL